MTHIFLLRLAFILNILTHTLYGYNPAVIMDENFLSKENSYIKDGLDAVASFNKKYKTDVPIITSNSLKEDKEEFLIKVAQGEYDPIISISFLFAKEVAKVSKMFPKKTFVVLDGNINDAKNILNINFKEEEGSFIVGVIAALKSKSDVIGFIGGMDVPVINSFGCGFAQGVKYIKPKAQILVKMVGDDHTAFNNPKKAEQLAKEMIDKGADVIYHAADLSGKGLIKAAIENDIYVIGVDFNQNYLAPGYILTSMLKRLDVAIYKVLLDSLNKQLSTDDIVLGLKEKGVSWSLDKYNIDLIDKRSLDRIEDIEFNVIHNIIKVEDYVKEQKCSYTDFN